MQVSIREANEEDFPGILSLIKEFSKFQGAEEKVTTTIEQMMEDKTFFQCFVAEMNNKEVVGFASFFIAYYSWTGKAVYLDDLYIKEAYRKQGTGKKLLDAVIDLARKEKCRKVRWQVSKWNSNAIKFYKSLGATIDETEINCDLIIQPG
jgi:L-amino acid N-acyltransferase YncA